MSRTYRQARERANAARKPPATANVDAALVALRSCLDLLSGPSWQDARGLQVVSKVRQARAIVSMAIGFLERKQDGGEK